MFTSLMYSSTGQVCAGIGYSLGNVSLEASLLPEIQNCYLGAVPDLIDWQDVWTGNWKKWDQECAADPAVLTPLIDPLVDGPIVPAQEALLWGGTAINSPGCFRWG